MLTDAQIKFLYKEAGLPEPDVAWVRKNLPTTENELKNVLRKQAQTIKTKAEQQRKAAPTDQRKPDEKIDTRVKDIFAKYGYEASQADIDYWSEPSKINEYGNLEANLKRRGDFDAKSGTKQKDEQQIADEGLTDDQKADIKAGHDWIDEILNSKKINEGQAAILHEIYAGDYTSGQKIPNEQEITKIIEDAATNAEKELKPYYIKTTGREIEDLKNQMANVRNESARYAQTEAVDYSQKLAQTKQNLRQRGMTFSGISRKQLGAEGALEAKGIEGQFPGARRMGWEDVRAGWQERTRDLGIAAERQLGSAGMPIFEGGIQDPYAQTKTYQAGRLSPLYLTAKQDESRYIKKGDITAQKEKEIERLKQEKISKYRAYP